MILGLTFAAYAVTLNGQPVLPRAQAAVVAGRILLPVRALGEALGAFVQYDAAQRQVVVRRGDRTTTLLVGGSVLVVDGRAYAPLRTVATGFGLDVAYEARSRTVALDDARQRESTTGTSAAGAAPPAQPPLVVTTSPGDGMQVNDPYPQISARFAGVSSIDPNSLQLVLDGSDVSGDAAVIGDQVLYTPRNALAPGRHDVRIDARAADGSPIGTAWSFDDSFAFAPPPPPAPFPISAIYVDRRISPGTPAFDVIVRGAPGLSGFVTVDGIAGIFPLQVATSRAYVAHVVVPRGLNQPFAHVRAQITLPNGTPRTIVLPQTIRLFTVPGHGGYNPPPPAPTPTATPARRRISAPPQAPRSIPTPTPSATPRPLARPLPRRTAVPPSPTPTPRPAPPPAAPSRTPTPIPTASPRGIFPRPTLRPSRSPSPAPA